jgi:hypothetical protein
MPKDTADFNAAMSAAAKSDGSQWALAFSIQEKLVQSRPKGQKYKDVMGSGWAENA